MEYLSSTDLIPTGHSTETAALRVLSDILQAIDNGDLAALLLLDMSAAFDTVRVVPLKLKEPFWGVCLNYK